MIRYPETFVPLEQLGKVPRPYVPTHEFENEWIDEVHRQYATCPIKDGMLIDLGIPGWLLPVDALKIYELAYFTMGDILELGCGHGLSTSILARAAMESGQSVSIHTIDLNPTCVADTIAVLRKLKCDSHVSVRCGDAATYCRELVAAGRKFGFVFIDHHHSYRPVFDVCSLLADLVVPGGLCLFHDYNDPRNGDAENDDYGVYQAVHAGLQPADFEFYGVFGCTGLFCRRDANRAGTHPAA